MIKWSTISSNYKENLDSRSLTENRPCPLCGELQYKPIIILKDFQFYSDSVEVPKRTDIIQCQCSNCFTLFMNPCYSPFGLKTLFAEAGASYGAPSWKYQSRANWLKKNINLDHKRSILDLGCHKGIFLSLMPDHLYRIGVDIDGKSIHDAKEKYPYIEFIESPIECLVMENKPDVISLFHVLEHLPRPLEFLRNLHGIAHQKTQLAIEVPVIENGNPKDINGFFSVHHLTHFTNASIERFLKGAGWQMVKLEMGNGEEGCRVLARAYNASDMDIKPDCQAGQDVYHVFDYLGRYYSGLSLIAESILRLDNFRKCVIWGAGCHTELLYQLATLFQQDPRREYLIVDSESDKWGTTWRNIMVYSPSVLEQIDWDDCILIVSSYGSQMEIVSSAKNLSVPIEKIFALY